MFPSTKGLLSELSSVPDFLAELGSEAEMRIRG